MTFDSSTSTSQLRLSEVYSGTSSSTLTVYTGASVPGRGPQEYQSVRVDRDDLVDSHESTGHWNPATESLRYSISGLEAGTVYYVFVSASNDRGRGPV